MLQDEGKILVKTQKEFDAKKRELKKEGFKREWIGYDLEKWTRFEWTKDNHRKVVYLELED